MIKKLKTILTAIALTAATVASANDIKELNFGIIATEKAGAMKQMWEPFLEDMTKATGIKINGFYATDYAGVIEAQRFNKVQLAWYGNSVTTMIICPRLPSSMLTFARILMLPRPV